MEDVRKDFVIKIESKPLVQIVKAGGVEALMELQKPWAVVIREENNTISTKGFDDQGSCAELVANLHGTDAEVVYVLKNGVPRKNVRIEVKARFR